MSYHPIEKIVEAALLMHKVATGQSDRAYMSVPADPERDADLILFDAIAELKKLRVQVAVRKDELCAASFALEVTGRDKDILKRREAVLSQELQGWRLLAKLLLGDDDFTSGCPEAAKAMQILLTPPDTLDSTSIT